MKTFVLAVAAAFTAAAVACGGGLATFVVCSLAARSQCAEAGLRHDVVATYSAHHGCTARGVFGVPVPLAIES